ncbi:MAG: 3-hydroxyacyl-CoA dehydrogenase NAD-binding domain-containing protein, partial [Solimonas sp.]
YAKAQPLVKSDAIFASNTSTLPINSLAEEFKDQGKFIGIHFFSPVEKMPLVEIIMGEQTSQETLAKTLDYVAQIKKTPIVVRDFPGFFTSRVFGSFVQEGLKMLLDGIEPALIENGARLAGFPVGPLAVSDEVTMVLQQSIYKQQDADNLPEKYRGLVGRPVVDKMVDVLKRPGRRYGAGFYDYPEGQPKKLWTGLKDAFPVKVEQPGVAEVKQRFLTIMALETARCFEEGVLSNPIDADIGSILGIGYPAWTGGTLSYIDTLGPKTFVEDCQRLAQAWGPRFVPSEWLLARGNKGELFYAPSKAA